MKQAFTYWIKNRFVDQQSGELNRLHTEGVLGWFYLSILIFTPQFHPEWKSHVCYITECGEREITDILYNSLPHIVVGC